MADGASIAAMRQLMRRAVESLVFVVIALIAWRTWYLEGLPGAFVVTGGSMAQTLLGPHREIVCGDCGFLFVCGHQRLTTDPRAVCPNCGYAGNDVRERPEIPGDRALVHRAMFQLRQPRRWEVIAFRTPGREREVSVKRVVGLPGELVEVRDGRVHINGVVARKTLEQQRATSVLVHDAQFAPHLDPQPPPRWRPETEPSGWSCREGRFTHPATSEQRPIDWLVYHHWRRVPGEPGRVQEGPVLTETSYNQGRRAYAAAGPTVDLRLSFRVVRVSGEGSLWVRATDGNESFQLGIDPVERRIKVLRNGRPVEVPTPYVPPRRRGPTEVDVSLIGEQLLVALDSRTVFTLAYSRPDHARGASARPFVVGVQGLELELDGLRVFRDIAYDVPGGIAISRILAPSSSPGGGEYFVLGDNAAISEDSRAWPQDRTLCAEHLVGKPFAAIPTIQWGLLKGRGFRIPSVFAIRYIR